MEIGQQFKRGDTRLWGNKASLISNRTLLEPLLGQGGVRFEIKLAVPENKDDVGCLRKGPTQG